jgi:hypothetical protein
MTTPMEIKLLCIEHVAEHERSCTTTGVPGTPCWGERANLIAFLCHGLGVRGELLYRKVTELLAEYDRLCDDPGCKHQFN